MPKMTPNVSVAVAQTCPAPGDVDANMSEHLRLAAAAADAGAHVVVFPELSLTGYELGLARSRAFTEDDARLSPLIELAAGRGVTIVAGAPASRDGRLHLGAFVATPDRRLQLYAKQRLGAFAPSAAVDGAIPPREDASFTAGEGDMIIGVSDTTAAIAICADIGNIAHPQRAHAAGARIYLASMFVIPSDFEGDAARLARYAREYGMVVALSNFGAPSGGLNAAGGSSIWDEGGELLARLPVSGAGVAVATRTSRGWHTRVTMLTGARTEVAATTFRASASTPTS